MVCMLLHYLLSVYTANSTQAGFGRFLDFVHEHPQDETFEAQGDMIVNADIIISRETTAYTNDHQVRIERGIGGDPNVNIDNFNNGTAWGSVDGEKTLTTEGSGENGPLVYMNTGVSAFGLHIHSTEGTALEIVGGKGLYAKCTDKKNRTSAEGENTIGVLNKNPYAEVKSWIPLSKQLGGKDSYTTIQLNLHLQLRLVFHISFFIFMMKITAGYYHTHYKG